jgi:hypothetical protein
MLPSVGVTSAKDSGNGGASVIDNAACTVDSAACTKKAHQTFSPLKHFIEMQKKRRTHTVLPCVMHIVVYGNNMHR